MDTSKKELVMTCYNRKFPDYILEYSELEVLRINYSYIEELPPEISKLKNLREFHFASVYLQSIPKELFGLPNLEELSLSAKRLKDIPEDIVKLRKLRRLSLWYIPAKQLPEAIVKLQNLEELTIYPSWNNKPGNMLEGALKLPRLKKLWLNFSKIDQIPNEITALSQLKELRLDNCRIKSISPAIGQLSKLELLHLANNRLSTIPESLLQLSQLKKLNITANKFEELPPFIAKLAALEELEIGRNPLKEYPSWLLEMPKLKKIPLDSRLGISSILRELIDQKMSMQVVKTAHALLTNNQPVLQEATQTDLVETCRSKDPKIRDLALAQLQKTVKNKLAQIPVSGNSKLVFLGKFKDLDLAKLQNFLDSQGIQYDKKVSAETTHVILGNKIPKRHKTDLYQHIVFISNQQLKEELRKNNGYGFLKAESEDAQQMRQSVQALLWSGNPDSITTALELIGTGGFYPELPTDLLIGYFVKLNLPLRHKIRQTLYFAPISEMAKERVRNYISNYYAEAPPQMHEKELAQNIHKYTKGVPEFDGLRWAKIYFEQHRKAYHYIFFYADIPARIEFLKTFIKDDILDLSGLAYLKVLPDEVRNFPNLKEINFTGCDFRYLPKVLNESTFPKLRKIILTKNPIRQAPKWAKTALPDCEIIT